MSTNALDWPETPNPLGSHPPRSSECRKLPGPVQCDEQEWPRPVLVRSNTPSSSDLLQQKAEDPTTAEDRKWRLFFFVATIVCVVVVGLATGIALKERPKNHGTAPPPSANDDVSPTTSISPSTTSRSLTHLTSPNSSPPTISIRLTTIPTSVERTVTLVHSTVSTFSTNSVSTFTNITTIWLKPTSSIKTAILPFSTDSIAVTSIVASSEALTEVQSNSRPGPSSMSTTEVPTGTSIPGNSEVTPASTVTNISSSAGPPGRAWSKPAANRGGGGGGWGKQNVSRTGSAQPGHYGGLTMDMV